MSTSHGMGAGKLFQSTFPMQPTPPRQTRDDDLALAQLIIANLVHAMGGSYTITDKDLVASAGKLDLDIFQSYSIPGLLIIKTMEKK